MELKVKTTMGILQLVVIHIIITDSVSCENETKSEYDILKLSTFDFGVDPSKAIFTMLSEHLETNSDEDESCDMFKTYLKIVSKDDGTENLNNMWLLKMIDSWSKIPSGILTGNIADNGQFDECFDLAATVQGKLIQGQYCNRALTLSVHKIPVSLSICIPSTCKLKNFDSPSSPIKISNILCQIKGPGKEFDWEDWALASVLIIILCFIIASTVYDFYLHYFEKKPDHQQLLAFSVLTNGRKLCTVSSNTAGQVTCINGMRTFSLMWIIAGHRFVTAQYMPSVNYLEAIKFGQSYGSTYISSARTAVDTFFFFSAFLVSYSYFKTIKSNERKAADKGSAHVENPLTFTKIPMFYLHRLLRVTPALLMAFFMQLALVRRLGEGPLWPFLMKLVRGSCTKWWWTLFLYVQNYVNYGNMCIVPTWYLCADMQMYMLAPFLLIPIGDLIIKGRNRLVYILLSFLIVLAIVIPMIVGLVRNFVIDRIYETHDRLSIYIIGILFGLLVVEYSNTKHQINSMTNLALWGLSLGVMIGIILGMHTTEAEPERVKNTLFFAFTRPLWTVGLCWIVFSCHFGHGGPVNWFLSLPIHTVLTRLSYSMYLIHNLIITVALGNTKVATHVSEYEIIYQWCGDYIFTVIVSIIWVLCFESPVVAIEKLIFPHAKRPQSTVQSDQNKIEA